MKFFQGIDKDFLSFWEKIAKELIHNSFDDRGIQGAQKNRSKGLKHSNHELKSCPKICKFMNGEWKEVYKKIISSNSVIVMDVEKGHGLC